MISIDDISKMVKEHNGISYYTIREKGCIVVFNSKTSYVYKLSQESVKLIGERANNIDTYRFSYDRVHKSIVVIIDLLTSESNEPLYIEDSKNRIDYIEKNSENLIVKWLNGGLYILDKMGNSVKVLQCGYENTEFMGDKPKERYWICEGYRIYDYESDKYIMKSSDLMYFKMCYYVREKEVDKVVLKKKDGYKDKYSIYNLDNRYICDFGNKDKIGSIKMVSIDTTNKVIGLVDNFNSTVERLECKLDM